MWFIKITIYDFIQKLTLKQAHNAFFYLKANYCCIITTLKNYVFGYLYFILYFVTLFLRNLLFLYLYIQNQEHHFD